MASLHDIVEETDKRRKIKPRKDIPRYVRNYNKRLDRAVRYLEGQMRYSEANMLKEARMTSTIYEMMISRAVVTPKTKGFRKEYQPMTSRAREKEVRKFMDAGTFENFTKSKANDFGIMIPKFIKTYMRTVKKLQEDSNKAEKQKTEYLYFMGKIKLDVKKDEEKDQLDPETITNVNIGKQWKIEHRIRMGKVHPTGSVTFGLDVNEEGKIIPSSDGGQYTLKELQYKVNYVNGLLVHFFKSAKNNKNDKKNLNRILELVLGYTPREFWEMMKDRPNLSEIKSIYEYTASKTEVKTNKEGKPLEGLDATLNQLVDEWERVDDESPSLKSAIKKEQEKKEEEKAQAEKERQEKKKRKGRKKK